MDNIHTKTQTSQPNRQTATVNTTKDSYRLLRIISSIVVILIVLYLISALTPLNILGLNKTSDEWKAVFLTNDQVYFGHVENEHSDTVVLSDIYYLQVAQSLQQIRAGEALPNLNDSQLQLVKLGNELHGPEDEMRINKEHILFIEDLNKEGRVVKAIEAFVAGE